MIFNTLPGFRLVSVSAFPFNNPAEVVGLPVHVPHILQSFPFQALLDATEAIDLCLLDREAASLVYFVLCLPDPLHEKSCGAIASANNVCRRRQVNCTSWSSNGHMEMLTAERSNLSGSIKPNWTAACFLVLQFAHAVSGAV